MRQVFEEGIDLVLCLVNSRRVNPSKIIIVPGSTKLVDVQDNCVGAIALDYARVKHRRIYLPVSCEQHTTGLNCREYVFDVVMGDVVSAAVVVRPITSNSNDRR